MNNTSTGLCACPAHAGGSTNLRNNKAIKISLKGINKKLWNSRLSFRQAQCTALLLFISFRDVVFCYIFSQGIPRHFRARETLGCNLYRRWRNKFQKWFHATSCGSGFLNLRIIRIKSPLTTIYKHILAL